MHGFSFLIELEVLNRLFSPLKKSLMSKLLLFFLNSKAWLWLLLNQGEGLRFFQGWQGQKELVKGSAGLAVAWGSVKKGEANTC